MRRRDPYSTPARRRRIIAEVTKSALRLYFLTACDNVHEFRIQTTATLLIQCAWRCFYAYKLRLLLYHARRRNAAVLIQSVWRMKLAGLERKRLWHERHLLRCKRLCKYVENLWLIRKARLYLMALAIAKRIRLEKIQTRACLLIERVYRGHQGRNRARQLLCMRDAEYRRRHLASMIIQKRIRGLLARKRFLALNKWHRARALIKRTTSAW